MGTASRPMKLVGVLVLVLATIAPSSEKIKPSAADRCGTLLQGSDSRCSYESIHLPEVRFNLGMGTSGHRYENTIFLEDKTLIGAEMSAELESLPHKTPAEQLEEVVLAAYHAVTKYHLVELTDHRDTLEELQKKLGQEEWDTYYVVLAENFAEAKNANDVKKIFRQLSESLRAHARIPEPLTRRKIYKHFDANGEQVDDASLAVRSEEAGWVDVIHVTKTIEIGPRTGKKVERYTASAGEGMMEGHPIHFPKMSWLKPPHGMTAKQWAEVAYGTVLEPLTVETPFVFEHPVDFEKAKVFIEGKLMEYRARLEEDITSDILAETLLSHDGLTLQLNKVNFHFKVDPKNPNRILMVQEVRGGQQRIYRKPGSQTGLVKVLDPELMPVDPENFVKLLQWNLAVIRYFGEIAAEQMKKRKNPDFLMNDILEDFTKLEHGASEVTMLNWEEFGSAFNIEDEHLPPDVERLFAAVKKYQFPLIQIKEARFGPNFVFCHRHDPEDDAHIKRFGLIVRYDHSRKMKIVVHGLDLGAIPYYDNIRRMRWHGGYIGIFIDQ